MPSFGAAAFSIGAYVDHCCSLVAVTPLITVRSSARRAESVGAAASSPEAIRSAYGSSWASVCGVARPATTVPSALIIRWGSPSSRSSSANASA